MANRVTGEDIKKINDLYIKEKSYAEVARQTGFSPSTVKKYVIDGYMPIEEKEIKRFSPEDMPVIFGAYLFRGIDNYGDLCVLSEKEKEEIYELQKEVSI